MYLAKFGTAVVALVLNHTDDLLPKRDPVRASLTPFGCMPLGRSSALGFLLNENGSGGIGEDNAKPRSDAIVSPGLFRGLFLAAALDSAS